MIKNLQAITTVQTKEQEMIIHELQMSPTLSYRPSNNTYYQPLQGA